jgi:hypothetical protein
LLIYPCSLVGSTPPSSSFDKLRTSNLLPSREKGHKINLLNV